jgi:hypothetical protein
MRNYTFNLKIVHNMYISLLNEIAENVIAENVIAENVNIDSPSVAMY